MRLELFEQNYAIRTIRIESYAIRTFVTEIVQFDAFNIFKRERVILSWLDFDTMLNNIC